MHKVTFYSKLAMGNLWRNKNTYLPYLLACTVSVFTFYTMLAINLNGALDGMRGESVVKSFSSIGAFILAIFCGGLIFYTNSFLVKRRKKELGLYSVLGMEKKNIAFMLFFETIFAAAISLVLGIILGILLSRLLFLILLRMVRFTVMLEMPVVPAAIQITIIFFIAVFLLSLLTNLWQVRIANPIDLMAGAKQGEKEPKASWLLTLVGIACVASGYYIALYYSSDSVTVLMLFLPAVFLVIIGTYCLFTSGSIALLKILRKNKKYYYKPSHFISVSSMIYRMKQNAAGLATICILSCMVLVTISGTVTLYATSENSLLVRYPSEYMLSFNAPSDGDALLESAHNIAAKTGTALENVVDYRESVIFVKKTEEGYVRTSDSNFTGSTAISLRLLEDYNRNENKNITLNKGEVLLFQSGETFQQDSLVLMGETHKIKALKQFGKTDMTETKIMPQIFLFLPDMDTMEHIIGTDSAEPVKVRRSISFDITGSEERKNEFLHLYDEYIQNTTTKDYFSYTSREDARAEWYAFNGGFLFLGIYFGILFMLAVVLIIYYKQISEGYDDVERFSILQKVGMSSDEVRRTINRQVLSVFFLPLLVSILHISVAFWPISRAMPLFGVVNINHMALCTLATVLVYAILYLLVYRQTAKTYYSIVHT